MSTTHEQERPCPNAHPSTPHSMRRDDGGWYCPHERDARTAESNREQARAEDKVEAASQGRAVIDRTLVLLQQHATQELSGKILCRCSGLRFPDAAAWAGHLTSVLSSEGLLATDPPGSAS